MSTTKKRHTLCLTANDEKMLEELCALMNSSVAEIYRYGLIRLYLSKFPDLDSPIKIPNCS